MLQLTSEQNVNTSPTSSKVTKMNSSPMAIYMYLYLKTIKIIVMPTTRKSAQCTREHSFNAIVVEQLNKYFNVANSEFHDKTIKTATIKNVEVA